MNAPKTLLTITILRESSNNHKLSKKVSKNKYLHTPLGISFGVRFLRHKLTHSLFLTKSVIGIKPFNNKDLKKSLKKTYATLRKTYAYKTSHNPCKYWLPNANYTPYAIPATHCHMATQLLTAISQLLTYKTKDITLC